LHLSEVQNHVKKIEKIIGKQRFESGVPHNSCCDIDYEPSTEKIIRNSYPQLEEEEEEKQR